MTIAREPEILSPVAPSAELDHIRLRVHQDFDALPADVIDHCFAVEMMTFEGCRITAFVPILVEKNVRQRLRAIQRLRSIPGGPAGSEDGAG